MRISGKTTRILSILLVFIFILSGCSSKNNNPHNNISEVNEWIEINEIESEELGKADTDNESSLGKYTEVIEDIEEKIVDGSLEVHFIDVGQGDSILIKQNEHSMLIDGGDNQYGQTVVSYLKENGVAKLDYVIGTHPHGDHIGGLDDVIYAFHIGKVILPNVTHTTRTFEDVLTAIQNRGLKITIPSVGENYKLGDASFTILAPNSNYYDNLNNFSVVIKLEYGQNSFLFTGDAEDISENEMINNGYSLKADALKVAHHGSNTSTTTSFLNAVNPKHAVIQVGSGNQYGHPAIEVINRLEQNNIKIHRNDLDGIIIAKSDGKNIEITKRPSPKTVYEASPMKNIDIEKENVKSESIEIYIGNKNSKIFHKNTCSTLPVEKNRVHFDSVEEAVNSGYRACKRCKP